MSNPTLRLKSRGASVKNLQKLLNQNGAKLTVDGIFGNNTLTAVKTFQKKKGLAVDGIVGTKTWAALTQPAKYSILKQGSHGTLVIQVQTVLTELGYQPGSIDGIFGASTKKAVIAFQVANKLANTNGSVGTATWARLLSDSAIPNVAKVPVYYSQGDSRWGSMMYSNHNDRGQTIANSGCGPTCMAMILATLIKASIQPPALCNFALINGYRTANNGTSWGFFPAAAKEYGLACKQTSSTDEVVKALKDGKIAIASMGKGYFTKGGHYIVLHGVEGNNILCHDPAKKARNKASIALFKKESKQYWVIG